MVSQMGRQHVDHCDIGAFGQAKVNLMRDKTNEYRAQVRGLCEKLEIYLQEHSGFLLKKMKLFASLHDEIRQKPTTIRGRQ